MNKPAYHQAKIDAGRSEGFKTPIIGREAEVKESEEECSFEG